MQHKDLSNLRFGHLTVLHFDHKTERATKKGCYRYFYKCKCDCGNTTIVGADCLKNGHVISCGCYRAEFNKKTKTTHGLRFTKLYKIWMSARQRCENPHNIGYDCYGGRGIKMCPEWKNDFTVFYNWAINNGYNEGLSIDRIDVNGNYCPENCRWVTSREQANNRRTNHFITYNGKTQSIADWCYELGLEYSVVLNRISKGKWSFERAIMTPKRCKK